MGTNYYLIKDNSKVHLGKISCGWPFLFFSLTELDYIKYMEEVSQGLIINEYDEIISFETFTDITNREGYPTNKFTPPFIKEIDGRHYCSNEFC